MMNTNQVQGQKYKLKVVQESWNHAKNLQRNTNRTDYLRSNPRQMFICISTHDQIKETVLTDKIHNQYLNKTSELPTIKSLEKDKKKT